MCLVYFFGIKDATLPILSVLLSIGPLLALNCDNNPSRAAIVSMLIEVDALPCAQRQPPVGDWHGQAWAHQRRLDVGRHVVRALVIVAVLHNVSVRGELVKGVVQVQRDIRRRILIDRQRRRGVLNEEIAKSRLHGLQGGLDLLEQAPGDDVAAARIGRQGDGRCGPLGRHAGALLRGTGSEALLRGTGSGARRDI